MNASLAIFEAEYGLSVKAKSAVVLAVALEAVDVAVHLARRGEDERQPALPAVLEHVEGHHRVLERAMRLRDELVHLRVRRQVDDDVGLRVRDAADPVREGRVLAGEVLEQVAEVVRPRVHALVDAEDLVAVGEEPEREVGADLPGRAGEQDLHAATAVRWAPRSVVEVALSIRTSTSSPGCGVAGEVDGELPRVRPRRSVASVRLAPSTSTSSTRADALGVPLGRDPLHDVDEPLEPLVLDLVRHLLGHRRPPRCRAAASR